jgi:hypothetical protein
MGGGERIEGWQEKTALSKKMIGEIPSKFLLIAYNPKNQQIPETSIAQTRSRFSFFSLYFSKCNPLNYYLKNLRSILNNSIFHLNPRLCMLRMNIFFNWGVNAYGRCCV